MGKKKFTEGCISDIKSDAQKLGSKFLFEYGTVIYQDKITKKCSLGDIVTDFNPTQINLPIPTSNFKKNQIPIGTIHSHHFDWNLEYSPEDVLSAIENKEQITCITSSSELTCYSMHDLSKEQLEEVKTIFNLSNEMYFFKKNKKMLPQNQINQKKDKEEQKIQKQLLKKLKPTLPLIDQKY